LLYINGNKNIFIRKEKNLKLGGRKRRKLVRREEERREEERREEEREEERIR